MDFKTFVFSVSFKYLFSLVLLSSRLYCRLWNFTRPTSMMRFVGFTTGGDLHPALKRFKILYYYNRLNRKGKRAEPRQGKSSRHKPALYVKA